MCRKVRKRDLTATLTQNEAVNGLSLLMIYRRHPDPLKW